MSGQPPPKRRIASTMTVRFSGGQGYFLLLASIRFGATRPVSPNSDFTWAIQHGLRHETAEA